MRLEVSIRRELSSFPLSLDLASDARRIGVLGASGAGKSMLLKCIAGVERPDAGSIRLDGRTLFDAAHRVNLPPQRRQVGYLFQSYALFPTMSVEENIGAGVRGRSRAERGALVARMVRRFELSGLEGSFPAQLSGGQKQRVALARLLAAGPRLILLDEPFSALDEYLRDRMQEELLELLEEFEGSVVMVSHSRDEVFRLCEEVHVLDVGRLVRGGPTAEVFDDPRTKAAATLTGCKNFSRACRLDAHRLQALDWGITIVAERRSVPEGLCHVGYRAHQFRPVWGPRQENCLRLRLVARTQLQFERHGPQARA